MQKLKQFFEFVLPLIRPRAGYWIAKSLVAGGIGILATPWWGPIIELFVDKAFGWSSSSNTTSIGFILILIGLGVYIFERRSDFSKEVLPDVIVLAHFAFLLDGKGVERCFIKISNSSPSKPVTITHVDYVGTKIVPILSMPLPHRLEAAAIFEVHIPLTQLPDPKSDDMLSKFRVTDSTGRRFFSVHNKDVSPVGYVS